MQINKIDNNFNMTTQNTKSKNVSPTFGIASLNVKEAAPGMKLLKDYLRPEEILKMKKELMDALAQPSVLQIRQVGSISLKYQFIARWRQIGAELAGKTPNSGSKLSAIA